MENKRIYLSSPTMHGEEQEFIREAFATLSLIHISEPTRPY